MVCFRQPISAARCIVARHEACFLPALLGGWESSTPVRGCFFSVIGRCPFGAIASVVFIHSARADRAFIDHRFSKDTRGIHSAQDAVPVAAPAAEARRTAGRRAR
jgi:hypothetical protein